MIGKLYLKYLLVLCLVSPNYLLADVENNNSDQGVGQNMGTEQSKCKNISRTVNDLVVESALNAPFIRWFASAIQATKSHKHENTEPSIRDGVKTTVLNTCMMAGMIGFHFIIKAHDGHESGHDNDDGMGMNGMMMCKDLDGSGHVPSFRGECTIPQDVGGVDHHFLNCTWHEDHDHGNHHRMLEEHGMQMPVGTQIGRLFLSMEIGMQVGHIGALWINKLMVDPLFDLIEKSE